MAKVLIVDDSPVQVLSLKKLVENWGHEPLLAKDGDQALEIAQEAQPDVILMDVVMPGMNGYQVTRELSKNQHTRDIPVIFISNRNGEADRVWGLRQGAVAYITKPIDPNDLFSAISDAITNYKKLKGTCQCALKLVTLYHPQCWA